MKEIGLKFFVISGAILILSGVGQAFFRQPKEGETTLEKVVNGATVRALVFAVAGTLGILVGLGVIPLLRL